MRLTSVTNELFDFGTNILTVKVPEHLKQRCPTGIPYVDALFGGAGLTPSAVTLFTGEAGAGKSTMLQLIGDALTGKGHDVVFVAGEESVYQLRMTSERLKLRKGFKIAQDTLLPDLFPKLDKLAAKAKSGKPLVVLFDSLQTLNDGFFLEKYGPDYVNAKTAERSLQMITDWTKTTCSISIVIGQVNKDGAMAGSNRLKHMVDSKLHLGIETKDKDLAGFRVAEMEKNRFGGCGAMQWLKMYDDRFEAVATAQTNI
jgi:DNA repair protein RadA/Sms